MRYWLLGFLTSLAGLAGAEDSAVGWDDWDELPEDVLELSGETSALALSERLDVLIQQQGAPPEELDRLLEVWLRQVTTARSMSTLPLQTLIGQQAENASGFAELDRGQRRELLEQLLNNLPLDADNLPAGTGPSSGSFSDQ